MGLASDAQKAGKREDVRECVVSLIVRELIGVRSRALVLGDFQIVD